MTTRDAENPETGHAAETAPKAPGTAGKGLLMTVATLAFGGTVLAS